MKWIAISGSWRSTSPEVENDVREFVSTAVRKGKGIVTGGALNVDSFATEEALKHDPEATHVKVCLPATLERYAAHYRKRADEGVITHAQAEGLISLLTRLKQANASALVEHATNTIIDQTTYYERNSEVLSLANELAAFQVNDSKGVQDTIDKARALGMPVHLKKYTIE